MKKAIQIISGAIITIIFLAFFFGGGLEKQAEKEINKIQIQVANDAVKQYEIAKRNGFATDAYVQAGLVTAAYLQANDEKNYKKWKKIEEQEAKNAGL
ncbi:hypothetical protein IWQ47_001287 [Aquimarina sp. EL_43]|uniref:hypothetical protein n=1 Tax=unclassified Aquimarina TaxID=2627091 RepID=UPI0018CA932A|nr:MULTISPECIES: hypothetical protein [unclassified Aquimarina]MBG6129410.1 hypothetical protein [Aquimarina sp. EL_35]MBG6150475.1 hypothetical protein [Aquimarina sp. EL_32]MBG6168217.1 hypothetical protein [Aquimarina sp. EL_43]